MSECVREREREGSQNKDEWVGERERVERGPLFSAWEEQVTVKCVTEVIKSECPFNP